MDVWAIGCIFVELITGRPLFPGESDYETLKLILQTFHGSEELSPVLKQAFFNNQTFQNADLPEIYDLDIDTTLEGRLSFLKNNSAISFARECLRMDPLQRPTCEELLDHDYFNDFRDWFEDEIQSFIEYDSEDVKPNKNPSSTTASFSDYAIPNLTNYESRGRTIQEEIKMTARGFSQETYKVPIKEEEQEYSPTFGKRNNEGKMVQKQNTLAKINISFMGENSSTSNLHTVQE